MKGIKAYIAPSIKLQKIEMVAAIAAGSTSTVDEPVTGDITGGEAGAKAVDWEEDFFDESTSKNLKEADLFKNQKFKSVWDE